MVCRLGQESFFLELAPEGKVLLDAHLPAAYQSYTVFKLAWERVNRRIADPRGRSWQRHMEHLRCMRVGTGPPRWGPRGGC